MAIAMTPASAAAAAAAVAIDVGACGRKYRTLAPLTPKNPPEENHYREHLLLPIPYPNANPTLNPNINSVLNNPTVTFTALFCKNVIGKGKMQSNIKQITKLN